MAVIQRVNWMNSDFTARMAQDVIVTDEGIKPGKFYGPVVIEAYPGQFRAQRTAIESGRGKPGKCRGCGGGTTSRIQRWLGIRWYGVPTPIRWFKRFTFIGWDEPEGGYPNCGCIYKLKNLWTALRS